MSIKSMTWAGERFEQNREAIEQEDKAVALFKDAVADIVAAAPYIYKWSNGEGGYIFEYLTTELSKAGFRPVDIQRKEPRRKTLSAGQRLKVWKRDGFVCKACGADSDLAVDHIIPFSRGGPDTMDNYQTLCRSCNSRKRDRV
jgi:HNH endonuclease